MVPAISIGPPETLVKDIVYACPNRATFLISDLPLEFNMTAGTTGWTSVTESTTGTTIAFPFVRSTTNDAIVCFKAL